MLPKLRAAALRAVWSAPSKAGKLPAIAYCAPAGTASGPASTLCRGSRRTSLRGSATNPPRRPPFRRRRGASSTLRAPPPRAGGPWLSRRRRGPCPQFCPPSPRSSDGARPGCLPGRRRIRTRGRPSTPYGADGVGGGCTHRIMGVEELALEGTRKRKWKLPAKHTAHAASPTRGPHTNCNLFRTRPQSPDLSRGCTPPRAPPQNPGCNRGATRRTRNPPAASGARR